MTLVAIDQQWAKGQRQRLAHSGDPHLQQCALEAAADEMEEFAGIAADRIRAGAPQRVFDQAEHFGDRGQRSRNAWRPAGAERRQRRRTQPQPVARKRGMHEVVVAVLDRPEIEIERDRRRLQHGCDRAIAAGVPRADPLHPRAGRLDPARLGQRRDRRSGEAFERRRAVAAGKIGRCGYSKGSEPRRRDIESPQHEQRFGRRQRGGAIGRSAEHRRKPRLGSRKAHRQDVEFAATDPVQCGQREQVGELVGFAEPVGAPDTGELCRLHIEVARQCGRDFVEQLTRPSRLEMRRQPLQQRVDAAHAAASFDSVTKPIQNRSSPVIGNDGSRWRTRSPASS